MANTTREDAMELDSVPSGHTEAPARVAGPGTCFLKVVGPKAFIDSIVEHPQELDEFGEPIPLGRVRLMNHALKVLYATTEEGEDSFTDSTEECSDSEGMDE